MAFGLIPDALLLALLTSTILAGVRRSTGLTFQTAKLVGPNSPTAARAFSTYLGAGEWLFGRCAAWAKGSKYFRYDPEVTVAEVRSQVGGFAEGIKAAAALAGDFAGKGVGAGAGAAKEE